MRKVAKLMAHFPYEPVCAVFFHCEPVLADFPYEPSFSGIFMLEIVNIIYAS